MRHNKEKIKASRKQARSSRTRSKIRGSAVRPRLSVFRSLNHIFLQLIDDEAGKTLASFHSKNLKKLGTKSERAKTAGLALAELAKQANITSCVFDRGPYRYHGRVRAAAEGARQGGLIF